MSIETLLEAAKFLELQALQQQKAREDEFKEKLLREQKTSGVIPNSTVHCNNITKAQGCHPALIQPPMPPASVPITVIPIPVVTPSHSVSPSLPVAPLPSTKRESLFNEDQNPSGLPCSPLPRPDHHPTSAPSTNHKQPLHNHQHHFIGQTANTSVQQQTPQHSIHRYTGSIVSPSPSQAVLPQSGTLLSTREVHNKLEKNRRAHLKECFETLRKNIPNVDEKKTSNLSVLRSALRYIQTLKRKEKEYEHDMERLAREKIATQQRLAELKNDLSQWMDVVEIDRVLRQTVQPEEDQASTSTASGMKPAQPSSPCITQHKAPPPTLPPPQPLLKPALTQTVTATISSSANSSALIPKGPIPALHPTVIAHSSVSHPSVIQTLNHVIQTPKHITHLAPPTSSGPVHLTPAQSPISHITVHPVTHLPALYSQPVAVTQPGIVGHITHTLNHAHPHLNGTATSQPSTAAIVGKQTTMGAQMVTHHTQLVGQTVLNPVTMVTMPSFIPYKHSETGLIHRAYT
uniref:Max-binding protein MNT n=1 Tax=Periophthalmus magnuspinnatus TaxID=409849 RepID=A0A3B4BCK9_9GOBI